MKRVVFVLVLVVAACTPAPPPPAPIVVVAAPPPAPASASASSVASVSSSASASASASASPSASATAPRRPSVHHGNPSRDERAFAAALRKDRAALLACQRASKNATGEMVVRVVMGVNGKVEATSVEPPSTLPGSLEDCVVGRIRAVRVEIAPTTLSLPLEFTKNEYDGPTVFIGTGSYDPGY
jgi:hypothetical protein